MSELLAVCPYIKCGKVIFRKAEIEVKTASPPIISWQTMCPHCKNKVKITFTTDITVNPIW